MVSDAKPERVQRFGPEAWEHRGAHDWSLWDLWFCVIAVRDHGGDLDAFAQDFVDTIRKPGVYGRDEAEAKLSHLHNLWARNVLDLVSAAPLVSPACAPSPSDAQDARPR